MMKDPERYVLTTSKAPVIQDVLSLVLGMVKSERNLAPGTIPSLEAYTKNGCNRMILELRRPKQSPVGISPTVRNIRVSHLGEVLVLTGDATAPEILREIEAIRRPHFSLQYLATGMVAFGHLFFSALGLGNRLR